MKKKVGIVTIFDNNNYGNRLQNYAVYKVLSLLDVMSENIVIRFENNKQKLFLKRLLSYKMRKGLSIFIKGNKEAINNLRRENFDQFSDVDRTNFIYSNSENCLKRDNSFSRYSLCVVGSDQVWNPDFAGFGYYFLDFVEPSKRIAFAASIGYTELPDEVLQKYTEYWKQMRYISVREDSAADIIEKATGKRPDVFLDPTLLLTKEEWDEVAVKPRCNIPDKYILCLFLGNMPETIKETYKKAYNMEMIILNDKTFPEYYVQGPAEFVWLIKNAQLILTDSFHCSVFSIIYHKQFWAFERDDVELKNMFTRMETLLNKFDMMGRVQKSDGPISFNKIEEKEFINADTIRSRERNRVLTIIGDIINEDEK